MSKRKAADKNILSQIKNLYLNSGFAQDAMETLLFGGATAIGQAMMTDMTPEEIAISTGLGMVGATAMRPVMGQIGYAVGRPLDKLRPNAAERMGGLAKIIPGTPQSVQANKDVEIIGDLMQAKYNQNYLNADGTPKGALEGFLGHQGRTRGDNLAQYAIAIGTPLVGNSGSETDETGMSYGSM